MNRRQRRNRRGFEVGNRVFWNFPVNPEFTGEYVVTSKRDVYGLVGIHNEKMQDRKMHWSELEHVYNNLYSDNTSEAGES